MLTGIENLVTMELRKPGLGFNPATPFDLSTFLLNFSRVTNNAINPDCTIKN